MPNPTDLKAEELLELLKLFSEGLQHAAKLRRNTDGLSTDAVVRGVTIDLAIACDFVVSRARAAS